MVRGAERAAEDEEELRFWRTANDAAVADARRRVPWLSCRGAEAADLAPPDDSELRVGVKSTTSTGTFTMHILSLSLQEDVNVYMYIYNNNVTTTALRREGRNLQSMTNITALLSV